MISVETIFAALRELNDELANKDIRGEICLVGGAAMCLAFNARGFTKDLDALLKPSAEIKEAALKVGKRLKLDEDWINDAVKGFMPGEPNGSIEIYKGSNLRVWAPDAEYLLAMKVLASRAGTKDLDDVLFLAKHLGLTKANDIIAIAEKYYGARLGVHSAYAVQELEDRGLLK